MRTTMDINDDLMRRAKKKAADDGVAVREGSDLDAAPAARLRGWATRRASRLLHQEGSVDAADSAPEVPGPISIRSWA